MNAEMESADPSSDPPAEQSTTSPKEQRRDGSLVYALVCYYFTSLIVLASVFFSADFVRLCDAHPDARRMDRMNPLERFGPWDGVWYRQIANDGYSYDPSRMSNVAFYPLYPTFSWLLGAATGLSAEASLLAVSQLFLLSTFVLLAKYLPGRPELNCPLEWKGALLVFALFPTSFYFRMSYSESTFLFFVLLSMYGIQKRWPFGTIAFLAGASTAARPVGLAVYLPFLWYAAHRSQTWKQAVVRAGVYSPICVWGIIAYMVYQHFTFGDPLAFVRTQIHWYDRMPPEDIGGKLLMLVSLEPFWSVYQPDCECYWANVPPNRIAEFNLHFMNPLFVLFAWGMIAIGAVKRILTAPEVLLSCGLLAIPYATHSFRACMASEARYAAVVFPVYIVVAAILQRAAAEYRGLVYAWMAFMLSIGAMMFTAWYWYF
ncbi:hypothetical protein Mal15_59790 [Stieleria maiorica]|uniref:Mannosyltransferase (PIG-V) n=1 Tax=Stieleria maiorica TaxID=2795974 RepID=A0A5B9MS57_9BACT|nr:hypothetical protein [Stieleria maiorica]QEG01898.1 hypothetical protein Mal15_59790 [Stieleria maiorica]